MANAKKYRIYGSHNIKKVKEFVKNIAKRHFSSEFKRKQLPIKITRDKIV